MQKSKLKILLALAVAALAPLHAALALQMPTDGDALASMSGISAQAYVVRDVATGDVLISKNADEAWTPASLTKLITAIVVLDTKPKLTKTVAITSYDQTLGACTTGGDCIKAVPGIKFTVDALFHAALMPSANNAASALARSTGLTPDQFVARMNAKAKSLGATSSHFYEPTGMILPTWSRPATTLKLWQRLLRTRTCSRWQRCRCTRCTPPTARATRRSSRTQISSFQVLTCR